MDTLVAFLLILSPALDEAEDRLGGAWAGCRVGNVIVEGNDATTDDAVRRDIEAFVFPGEPARVWRLRMAGWVLRTRHGAKFDANRRPRLAILDDRPMRFVDVEVSFPERPPPAVERVGIPPREVGGRAGARTPVGRTMSKGLPAR